MSAVLITSVTWKRLTLPAIKTHHRNSTQGRINMAKRSKISVDAIYGLDDFMERTGLKRDAMRAARRNGLRVIYRHNRGFVTGRDWLSYLSRDIQCSADKVETENGHE